MISNKLLLDNYHFMSNLHFLVLGRKKDIFFRQLTDVVFPIKHYLAQSHPLLNSTFTHGIRA